MSTTVTRTSSYITRLLTRTANKYNIANQSRYVNTKISKLIYSEYGDPVKVLKREDEVIDNITTCIKPNEAMVKMLASPVNPADINTIEGKYPVKPAALPSVPGNEGVGDVIAVGEEVSNIAVGDRVVLFTNLLGTWRSHLITQSEFLFKIPKDLGIIEAATLTVNPCTAYRMLKDFEQLDEGDSVIQNGANSAAGQNIIQLCHIWGIKSVNIVRDRPNIESLKNHMYDLGATLVLTEEELRTTKVFKDGKLPKPRLGLNCVGGKSSLELLRHLERSGTLVTYGGMSREPVIVPTGPLIFKDFKLRGFWMTEWSRRNANSVERVEMLDEIIALMLAGKLKGPSYDLVPFDDYKEAINNTINVKGKTGKKYILDFTRSSMPANPV